MNNRDERLYAFGGLELSEHHLLLSFVLQAECATMQHSVPHAMIVGGINNRIVIHLIQYLVGP